MDIIHSLSSSSARSPAELEKQLQQALSKVKSGMLPEMAPIAVIGGGLSGLTASLRLLKAGVRVALIDKRKFWGGNSAKASSGINGGFTMNQKDLGINDSADQFYQDTMQCSGREEGSLTERLIRTMSDGSKRAVEWIESSTKVKLSEVGQLGGHSAARTHRPREGLAGASFISGLERAVLQYRASGRLDVLKGHRMTRLVQVNSSSSSSSSSSSDDAQQGGRWDVELEIEGDEKKQMLTLRAHSVVLATGGYGNDKDGPGSLLREVAPHLMNLRSTNGAFTTGDGIKVARELGASTIDLDMVQVHPTGFSDRPTGFKDNGSKNSPLILCAEILRGVGSILLDSTGKRFVNELETRKNVVEKMNETGENKFVLVLPPKSSKKVEAHVNIYTGKGLLIAVEGIEGVRNYVHKRLGGNVGSNDGSKVIATLDEMRSEFETTTKGTHPIKRNSPTILNEKGTYYVGIVQPVLHYTMGGLMVDVDGRVLKEESGATQPMEGLYAAGEIMGGVHGENRLGGSSLLDCVVFGLASSDHILVSSPEIMNSGGFIAGSGSSGEKEEEKEEGPPEEPPVASKDQLRVKVEDRFYDLSRFVDLHPGGALSLEKGEDLTQRFKEAHGKDWNLFERDEITQVTEEGKGVRVSDKPKVEMHRTANYGGVGGSWREILGRRTWFFLHSVAAKYPDHPEENDKESVRNLVASLGQHYPCKLCRKHLKQQLRELRPVAVGTRQELTVWFCELHNMVNKDIGKKQFDCNPFKLDMEYLKDCGECEVVKVKPGDAKSLAAEKAKSGYHATSGPWDSSLYQRDPLLLSSVTSVTDAWEAKDADDMLTAMKILGVVDKKKYEALKIKLREGPDARNDMLDMLADAVMVAKDAVLKDKSGKDLTQ